jgi:dTMP kinase
MTVHPFRTVALVGIDGSGKTTQAHLLAAALAEAGWPASYRRNAGGRHWFGRVATAFGRRDAEELLGRRMMLVVESLLRWLAILRTMVRRAVTGEIAIMDRYAVCQYASLRARGASPAAERRARLAYRLFARPDVTVLLAVDPEVAYERIEARGYDHEELSYLRAAAAAYRSLPEYRGFAAEVADRIRAAMLPPATSPPTPSGPTSSPPSPPTSSPILELWLARNGQTPLKGNHNSKIAGKEER